MSRQSRLTSQRPPIGLVRLVGGPEGPERRMLSINLVGLARAVSVGYRYDREVVGKGIREIIYVYDPQ